MHARRVQQREFSVGALWRTRGCDGWERHQRGFCWRRSGGQFALAGKSIRLQRVVITDSSGTPKTLDPAQYKVHASQGAVEFLDITTDGPMCSRSRRRATKGAAVRTAMFKTAQPQLWLRFDGGNTADGTARGGRSLQSVD